MVILTESIRGNFPPNPSVKLLKRSAAIKRTRIRRLFLTPLCMLLARGRA